MHKKIRERCQACCRSLGYQPRICRKQEGMITHHLTPYPPKQRGMRKVQVEQYSVAREDKASGGPFDHHQGVFLHHISSYTGRE
jgi:hypothetical protein